jgi:hypothetical protein
MQYAEKSVAKKRQENDSSRTARKPDNFGACQDAVQRTLTKNLVLQAKKAIPYFNFRTLPEAAVFSRNLVNWIIKI